MIPRARQTTFAWLVLIAGCGIWETKKPQESLPQQSEPISRYENIKPSSYADRIGIASVENLAMSGPGASRQIAEYLADPNPKVRKSAVKALTSFGKQAEPAANRISELAVHIDPDIRASATKALVQTGIKTSVHTLSAAKKDPSPTVRVWAHAGLAKLDGDCEQHMEEVASILQEGRMKEPEQAADSMAWMGCANQEGIQALIHTLNHGDIRHQAAAARAIGQIGPRAHEAVFALVKCLSDSSSQVRSSALLGIAGLKDKGLSAVPALIETLRDPVPRHRELAAFALGEMGPAARSAVSALQKATRDPQANVQAAAKRALAAILR